MLHVGLVERSGAGVGTHFDALGFRVECPDDLEVLKRTVIADTDPVTRSDGGLTYVRGTNARAAVVIHTERNGSITVVEPFLSSETRLPARFEGIIHNAECVHLSPVVVSVETDSGPVRFGFVTPHVLAWWETLMPGVTIEVGVCGLVEDLELLEADAADEFSPVGLDLAPAQPTARVCGVVTEHFLRHNELGGPFEWAMLDVAGMPLEISAAPSDLEIPFQHDMVVRARVRLSGPIWGAVE